jgi:hypothetical protein
MDYFTNWLEAYATPNQEASTVAEALVTNFFCPFGVPQELQSDMGHNFESRLITGVAMSGSEKDAIMPLHPQLDGTVEGYIKMVEEHLPKVIGLHQRNWDSRLPILLMAFRASTHDVSLMPASLVFRRELRLPCDLLFGTPPTGNGP